MKTGGTYLFPPLYSGGNKPASSLLHKKKIASAWDFGTQSRLKFWDPYGLAITSTYFMPVVIWDYYLIIIKVSSPRGHKCAECHTVQSNFNAYETVTTGHNESQWVTNTYNDLKMCHIKSQPTHALWDLNEKHKSSR